jgi:hypothetical protein
LKNSQTLLALYRAVRYLSNPNRSLVNLSFTNPKSTGTSGNIREQFVTVVTRVIPFILPFILLKASNHIHP